MAADTLCFEIALSCRGPSLYFLVANPLSNQLTSDQRQALRVLDANANRAAEGLRTLEDYARLVREDAGVAAWIKQLRHRLTAVLSPLPRTDRLAARSTHLDVGTELTTEQEATRDDLASTVPAACERVTQSLRNLEEFSKLFSVPVSGAVKQLRYEAYDLLAQCELRLSSNQRLTTDQQLYLLVDCSLPVDDFRKSLQSLAVAGVDLFQLRDKRADGARLMQYARAGVAALSDTSAKLIVNDRVDVALASGAAGVHLGQDDMSLADAQALIVGRRMWIGISTHDIEQALQAEQHGADYIGCGPTFHSQTKSFDAFAGTQFLKQAAEKITIPFFAIGGISVDNVGEVLLAGCWRVAVSAVIHQSADALSTARAMKERLSHATSF